MLKHTPVLSLAWQIAAIEAADNHYEFIEPIHFFIGLCKLEGFANVTRLRSLGVPESQVSAVEAEIDLLMGLFERFGINATTIRHELRQTMGKGTLTNAGDDEVMMHRSEASKKALDYATGVAQKNKETAVSAVHLLAGLLSLSDSPLHAWLSQRDIDVLALQQSAAGTIVSVVADPSVQTTPTHRPTAETATLPSDPLSQYGLNITAQMKNQSTVPAFVPDSELKKIWDILQRSQKNNPLLLAEKEGLAKQIVYVLAWNFQHNPQFKTWEERYIIQVNLDMMADKINYQGEFADRLQRFIETIGEDENVILFIDNIERVLGSGSIHVDMDHVISTLMQVLEDDKIRCIGATFPLEYHRYIERKQNFRRVFYPHDVNADISITQIPTPSAINTSNIATPPSRIGMPSAVQKSSPSTGKVDIAIQGLKNKLSRFGIELEISQSALALLSKLATQGNGSALSKAMETHIENVLGGMILRNDIDYGQSVRVDGDGGRFTVRPMKDF